MRTDWTIDYASPANYTGTAVAPNDVRAKIQSLNFLFNGYLDLGTWHRLTPYIGGGAGAALVRVSDYQSAVTPPLTGNGDHSEWNFAYAGMAGVAWAVAPNLMIDFGYRYLNVGDAHTARDASGAMTFKSVAAHEARIGLRWNFDDAARISLVRTPEGVVGLTAACGSPSPGLQSWRQSTSQARRITTIRSCAAHSCRRRSSPTIVGTAPISAPTSAARKWPRTLPAA